MTNTGLVNRKLPNTAGAPTLECFGLALLPLAVSGSILNDPTDVLTEPVTRYAAKLVVDGLEVEVPISSWQATLQIGAQNYAQIVIPAASNYEADISLASGFNIYSRVTSGSSDATDYLILSSQIDSLSNARSARRNTTTVRGYFPQDFIDNTGNPQFTRELTGIRTITTNNESIVARSRIDFLLQPNQQVIADNTTFTARYINYFVNVKDSFMDVGTRQ